MNDLLKAAETLDNSEVLILRLLAKKKTLAPEEIASQLKLDVDRVRHDCARLTDHGLVEIQSISRQLYSLGEEGKRAVKEGLPEKNLILKISKKNTSIADLDAFEKSVSLAVAKRNDWIAINADKTLALTPKGKKALKEKSQLEKLLNLLSKQELSSEELAKTLPDGRDWAEHAKNRGTLVFFRQLLEQKVSATEKGVELGKLKFELKNEETSLTPELLKGGAWRKAKFRKYNLTAPTERVWPGRKHPNRVVMEKIRNIFLELGFKEMKGPWVETAFWNMDSMFIPQDHPAREVQDTFYLDGKGDLPEVSQRVKEVQETGKCTGFEDLNSKGYGGVWRPEVAAKLLLRTHTTATTFRMFGQERVQDSLPVKYFSIGRIFRNEALDATHLPEFYQVEGFVMGKDVNMSNLFGYLGEFFKKMGFKKLRFKPTYNPYTEPSAEVYGYNEVLGKWVEIGNSGMFRPEALAPYGVPRDVRVVAWGLGIERMSMDLYKRKDIRDILGAEGDLDWLRGYELK